MSSQKLTANMENVLCEKETTEFELCEMILYLHYAPNELNVPY